MSELITASRPYARAIFELAEANKDEEKWSQQLTFMAAVAADASMIEALDNPKLSKQQTAELFIKVCDPHLDKQGINLTKLLAENDRLVLLPEITTLYEKLRSEAEGSIDAEVISAFEVSDEQQKAIAKSLKKRLGRDVKLTTRIDTSLMGGAIIRAGDLVIDGSLQGRLTKIGTTLSR
jgi:F-type H+-transporting ATPase subunit delta